MRVVYYQQEHAEMQLVTEYERKNTMKSIEIRQRMKDMNISPEQMAKELKMDKSTYYRKMQNNGAKFSACDLTVFKRVLKMDEKTALDFLLS